MLGTPTTRGPPETNARMRNNTTVREAVQHRDIAQGFPDQPRAPITIFRYLKYSIFVKEICATRD